MTTDGLEKHLERWYFTVVVCAVTAVCCVLVGESSAALGRLSIRAPLSELSLSVSPSSMAAVQRRADTQRAVRVSNVGAAPVSTLRPR